MSEENSSQMNTALTSEGSLFDPGTFPEGGPGEQPGFPPSLPCPHYSGLYRGRLVPPAPPRGGPFPVPDRVYVPYELDLRIDIDATLPSSSYYPVLNKVSGDFYRIYEFKVGNNVISWRVYQGSWIVDNPVSAAKVFEPCTATITGEVRFYRGTRPPTNISIHIVPNLIPGATVNFIQQGSNSPSETYLCQFVSNSFRHVTLEVDVCQSVNAPPILPTYDTNYHPDYPTNLPRRLLTVETAYLEAGIGMTVNPVRSIIDDTVLPDTDWLPAELHDAMETYFDQYPSNNFFAAQWNVWAMLASGVYVEQTIFGPQPNPYIVGVMFDARVEAPDRQGCAIFREHGIFNNLPANGVPANQPQAYSLRSLLFTYVHEIGHAFNLLHSWQKHLAYPPAQGDEYDLSWMNYPQEWAALHGSPNNDDIFWQVFPMTFTDSELIHLRHGDRSAVIFGGTPFGQDAALEDIPLVLGEAPIQFIVRGKRFFRFLEPVILEFKVKNVTQDLGLNLLIELNTELSPEYSNVLIYIQRPDGRILVFEPAMYIHGESRLKELEPGPQGRYCQNVMLSFGKHGHYFVEPGRYRVRVLYRGFGGMLIASNVHELRIGRPSSRQQEQDAQDFYSYAAGMALYLGGSDSPHLESGMGCLRTLAERHENSPVGAQLSLVLAQNQSRPFRRVVEVGHEQVKIEGKQVEVVTQRRIEERPADPQKALKLVNRALRQHEDDPANTFQNIGYHQASRAKATFLATIGQRDEAVNELDRLIPYLRSRDVKDDVLGDIEAYKQKLPKEGG